MSNIKLFQNKKIRSSWNQEEEQWYFSVVDVVEALTDSPNPTDYLKKMRKRDAVLGCYIGTNCPQVIMLTEMGKKRKTLTAEISKATFGMTPSEYKEYKGLTKKNQNLRDHMDDLELIFTMLGERVTTELSETEQPDTFQGSKKIARRGGNAAGKAREVTEEELGRSIVSKKNFLPDKGGNFLDK